MYYSSRSHGTAVCRTTCKEHERTTTVALPTAASAGFILGDLGTSAAIDAFSTVYELPLTRFENRQTDKQTNKHFSPRGAIDGDRVQHFVVCQRLPRLQGI